MKPMRNYILVAFLLLIIFCVLKFNQQTKHQEVPVIFDQEAVHENPKSDTSNEDLKSVKQDAPIPAYVIETLNYILKHDKAPDRYVGGRIYFNRNKALPQKDVLQRKIQYREWDVHPKRPGQNRGAERLVTGSDQSAYFTKDHYNTFIKINL